MGDLPVGFANWSCQDVYSRLSETEACDYDVLKGALLGQYDFTEGGACAAVTRAHAEKKLVYPVDIRIC